MTTLATSDEARGDPAGPPQRAAAPQKSEIHNIRADAARRRSGLERGLATTARVLAHPLFFVSEIVFHAGWIILNEGHLAGVAPWDPYPYPLLTGIASTQGLLIGLLILMYARRDSRVDEVREESLLQVSLHTEREASRLLEMMEEVQSALGIHRPDRQAELDEMKQPLQPERLTGATAARIRTAEDESG